MNYKETMEWLYLNCQATKENILVDNVFETKNGKIRMVLFDFPKTIGKNIKVFDEDGLPIKIDLSKRRTEMNFYEYVNLLCNAKINFNLDMDENERDGKTVIVAHNCECGCVTLPTINEFKRYELSVIA